MTKESIHGPLIVLIAFIVMLSLSSCGTCANNVRTISKQSLYDRVISTGKIRCAYVVYAPDCIKDPNTGKLSGIGIEAIELVAKKLGLTVEWTEEVGWGTMLEGLQTGRYDLVASLVWTNANRAKLMGFSKPLFYSPIFVYARKGDHRYRGQLEKINSPKAKIVTIDGETAQVIADADFPQSSRLSMPQMTEYSQVSLSLASGKADIALLEPAIANEYVRNNPGSIESISEGKPIRVFPTCWMFNRGEFEFKAMIDTVLDEVINSGAMDKILRKYEKAPNELYRVALPYKMPKQ